MREPWSIYILVFCAALLAVEGAYWLIFRVRGAKKAVNRRLALSQGQATQTQVLDKLRQERGVADFKSPTLTRFNDFFVQTGLRLSRRELALWTLLLAVALGGTTAVFDGRRWLPAVVAVACAPPLVFLYLKIVRARRIARFGAQLPNAIDVIVRGLRIGYPFSSALELVAREMLDPIGTEFGMTADEMAFGRDIVSAVHNLYRRVGQEDLLFLVIAVTVQSQTGGNLAEVLVRLSRLLRERAKLRLKVKALSAEGRLSAWFLSAMPFVLYAVIEFLAPSYFSELRKHPLFVPALVYGWTSLIVANYVMYRMVNFKI